MGTLAVIKDTSGLVLPALAAGAGERAAWHFVEFFTVNIRKTSTRAAYGRATGAFLCWCEGQGITGLAEVLPEHVAAYQPKEQIMSGMPVIPV